MLNKLKHGQTAMEFLMTYGWAILVMLVVVAVLFYLGVLNPQAVAPNSLTFPSGFSAQEFKVESSGGTGMLTLDLGQGTGKAIEILGVACTNSETEPTNPGNVGNLPLEPGEHALIANGDVECTGSSDGQYYKGKVYVWYMQADSMVDHKIIGDLAYRVE